MKTLNTYIESLLDDEDELLGPERDKPVIEKYIKENYSYTGNLKISDDFTVDCSGGVTVKNTDIESLTNGMFRWGKVVVFDCSNCKKLKSLKGAPKEVGYGFGCSGCINLGSLEGAPKEVGGDFDCSYCNDLENLVGGPKIVGGCFYCKGCKNLKSLEGGPKRIGEDFYCINCPQLKITDKDRKKYYLIS